MNLLEPSSIKRRMLLIVASTGIFFATFIAGYWSIGMVLYFNVFGDDSPGFGRYAAAISLPLSSAITIKYCHYCVSHDVSQTFLIGSLLLSLCTTGLMTWPMTEPTLGRWFDAFIRLIAALTG